MSDTFISYSRCDTDFVRQVFGALSSRGCKVWIDWQGIDYSTKWWEEICTGIEGADNFVLIISPDSTQSVYCQREIEHARKYNKRIVPVLYHLIEERDMIGGWYTNQGMRPFEQIARDNWESIKAIQWIEYSKLGDIDKLLSALLNTVDIDSELVRFHTQLLLRVREWEMRGRIPDAQQRGVELSDYERWLSECEQSELKPKPTSEQRIYISWAGSWRVYACCLCL